MSKTKIYQLVPQEAAGDEHGLNAQVEVRGVSARSHYDRMPTPEAEAIVREWFERVWNEGDESAIDRLLAPTAVGYGLPGGPIHGGENFKPFARGFRSAFPNLHIEIIRTVTEGHLCAAHCRVTGTHRGDGLGFAATGREMAMEGMDFMRVEGGLIHEGWNSFDFLLMYQQLGVIPQLS